MSEGRRRSIILTWKLVLVFFLDDGRFESDLMLEFELYGAMIRSVDGRKGCIGVADGFGVSWLKGIDASEGGRRSIILTRKKSVLVFFLDNGRSDFESNLVLIGIVWCHSWEGRVEPLLSSLVEPLLSATQFHCRFYNEC